MPKHKIQRQEEISTENWHKILALSEQINYEKSRQIPPHQLWLTCVLAIAWLTGKRINEILSLQRSAIKFTKTLIRIKFQVGKKRSKGSPIELQPYQKARNINHQAVPYIKKYLAQFDADTLPKNSQKTNYLFPANTNPRTRKVTTQFTDGKGQKQKKQYSYTDLGGYVFEENARYYLAKINNQLLKNEQIYFQELNHFFFIHTFTF